MNFFRLMFVEVRQRSVEEARVPSKSKMMWWEDSKGDSSIVVGDIWRQIAGLVRIRRVVMVKRVKIMQSVEC